VFDFLERLDVNEYQIAHRTLLAGSAEQLARYGTPT
jgi:hypothetical protein